MGNLGLRIGIEGLGEASLSARSFYAPALTGSRGAANAWLRLRSFDSPALVFSADQNLFGAQGGRLMEGRCAGADEGGLREAVLSDVRQIGHIVHHCAGEWGADCGSKVLGCCGRGGKGRRQARLWQSTRRWAERRRGACMVWSMRRPDTLKGRSLLVAGLQAS